MNKDDLLKKIREDNETKDPMQSDFNRTALTVAAIGALVVSLITYLLELFICGKDNVAVFIVLLTSYFLGITVKAIKTKSVFFIVMAIWIGLMLITLTVVYSFMLVRGTV